MDDYKDMKAEDLYGDIIDLPHYEPKYHPRMDLYKRAAQFAPFSALTGYGDAVEETARYTEERRDLMEDEMEELDRKLAMLRSEEGRRTEIRILYFKADAYKEGGSFEQACGRIRKLDDYSGHIIMEDGSRIPVKNIMDLERMSPTDVS